MLPADRSWFGVHCPARRTLWIQVEKNYNTTLGLYYVTLNTLQKISCDSPALAKLGAVQTPTVVVRRQIQPFLPLLGPVHLLTGRSIHIVQHARW